MTTRQTFDPLEYYFKLCKDVDDDLQDQLVMHMIHNGYIGEENRVTREQLSIALLGEFTPRTDRMIRKAKEELLKKGMLILSSSGTAGYYLPAFQDEVDEYIRENTNRIHALLQNVRMAKQVRLPYRQPDHVRQMRFLEVR